MSTATTTPKLLHLHRIRRSDAKGFNRPLYMDQLGRTISDRRRAVSFLDPISLVTWLAAKAADPGAFHAEAFTTTEGAPEAAHLISELW